MSVGHFRGVRYHRMMLADRGRTEAYATALESLVRPGDVVLDVGTGTGILAMLAARAGAAKVYAVESTPMARIARNIVADNNLADVVEVIEADARTVKLPHKANVLVTECMGDFVFSDAMLGVLADCRDQLAPDARICPATIDMFMAPASVWQCFMEFDFWTRKHYDFRFHAAHASAENEVYNIHLPSLDVCVAEPQRFGRIVLTEPPPVADRSFEWRITRKCRLDAVVGWFSAALTPELDLATGPGTHTHWGQMIFPVPSVVAEEGDRLQIQVSLDLGPYDMPAYSWRGVLLDGNGKTRLSFERSQHNRFDPQRSSTQRF